MNVRTCDCMERIDAHLKERNLKLVRSVCISSDGIRMPDKLVLATEKINSKVRRKPRVVVAHFCPFCGAKNPL